MGLHLPSAAFVHPHTPLRDALTAEAAKRVLDLTAERGNYTQSVMLSMKKQS